MKNFVVSSFIFVSFTYALLVVSDYGLARYLSYAKTENKKHNELYIMVKKYLHSQLWSVEEAKKQGYEYIFNPYAVDHYPITKNIARKLNYAPPGGKPNQDTFWCDEGYGLVKYTSDRHGFRNVDTKWNTEVENIFIGDSITAGACVDVDKSFVGLFDLSEGNTINLSTGGNTPIHYASLAKRFITKLGPKRVFMVFFPNDNIDGSPGDTNSVYYSLYLKSSLAPDKSSDLFWEEADNFINDLNNGIKPSFLEKGYFIERFMKYVTLPTMRKVLNKSLQKYEFEKDLYFTSRLALDALSEECLKVGCDPVVVFIPNSKKWQPGFLSESYSRKLKEYSVSKNMKFIDTTSILKADGETSSYANYGGHLSPKGNSRVVELLFESL